MGGGDLGTYREIWHFDITAAQAREGNLSISKTFSKQDDTKYYKNYNKKYK